MTPFNLCFILSVIVIVIVTAVVIAVVVVVVVVVIRIGRTIIHPLIPTRTECIMVMMCL